MKRPRTKRILLLPHRTGFCWDFAIFSLHRERKNVPAGGRSWGGAHGEAAGKPLGRSQPPLLVPTCPREKARRRQRLALPLSPGRLCFLRREGGLEGKEGRDSQRKAQQRLSIGSPQPSERGCCGSPLLSGDSCLCVYFFFVPSVYFPLSSVPTRTC